MGFGRNVVRSLENETQMLILLTHRPIRSKISETDHFAAVSEFFSRAESALVLPQIRGLS